MKKEIQKRITSSGIYFSLAFLFLPSITLAAGEYNTWLCNLWAYIADIILPVATIMIMWAGFIWTTSSGEPGKITKAKEIIWGVLSGLGFLLLSYILMKYVIGIDVSLIPGNACIWNKTS